MQRSGIDTINYHSWSRTPYGKVTKHKKTSYTNPFPAADHKASRIATQYDKDKHENDQQKKRRIGTVSKKITRELKHVLFDGTNLTLISNINSIETSEFFDLTSRNSCIAQLYVLFKMILTIYSCTGTWMKKRIQ